jgi:LmbE family N-acetylglucosaminyl deacetylase
VHVLALLELGGRIEGSAATITARHGRAVATARPRIGDMLSDAEIERVLCVAAHPDDIDYGAAGTVAKLTGRGVEVSYCVITDGQAGEAAGTPRDQVAALRQAEQRRAAQLVGVSEVCFLGYPDGALTPGFQLRRDLAGLIRRLRPDLVITHSPQRNLDQLFASHPDHLAAGEAALCAVYPDARNGHAHPELAEQGLQPWTVREVWLVAHAEPDLFLDVTESYELKLAAIRAHASQHDPARPAAALDEAMRGMLGRQATAAGLPDGRLAEAFRRVATG